METKLRSASKSIIWRIAGILILGAVTFFYTRHWMQTSLITFCHHSIFLLLFYMTDRFWLHIDWKPPFHSLLNRSIFKTIFYETILGTFILGVITLSITGNVQKMTQITIVYIFLKHVLYVWHEFLWSRIQWGKK